MTRDALLAEIEERLVQLSHDEQLWLIERVAHRLRQAGNGSRAIAPEQLAAMAADPEIQRELREIAAEFSATEMDGLEQP
jgi:hypothetical protein